MKSFSDLAGAKARDCQGHWIDLSKFVVLGEQIEAHRVKGKNHTHGASDTDYNASIHILCLFSCSFLFEKDVMVTEWRIFIYCSALGQHMYKQALQHYKIIPKQNTSTRSSLSASNSFPNSFNASAINENEVD